jgi:hypothetical protein
VLEQLLIRSLLQSCLNNVQQNVQSALSVNARVFAPRAAVTASDSGPPAVKSDHRGPIHRRGSETRQSSLGLQDVPSGYAETASGMGAMYSVS